MKLSILVISFEIFSLWICEIAQSSKHTGGGGKGARLCFSVSDVELYIWWWSPELFFTLAKSFDGKKKKKVAVFTEYIISHHYFQALFLLQNLTAQAKILRLSWIQIFKYHLDNHHRLKQSMKSQKLIVISSNVIYVVSLIQQLFKFFAWQKNIFYLKSFTN